MCHLTLNYRRLVFVKRSVPAAAYGRFLNTIFDEWVRNDIGKIFIQLFDESVRPTTAAMPTPTTTTATITRAEIHRRGSLIVPILAGAADRTVE